MATLSSEHYRDLVRMALREDILGGDITTGALIDPQLQAVGRFMGKESGVVCGLEVAAFVFAELSDEVRFEPLRADGDRFGAPQELAVVRGPAAVLLTGERTALNFLQRLSGVASLTHRFVKAVAGTGVHILDTRKTSPGYRHLHKYAVRCGGGHNHRMGLFDEVLVKDNHLRLRRAAGGGVSFQEVVALCRQHAPEAPLELEVENLEQLELALAAGPDRILLDNMSLDEMREAVAMRDRMGEPGKPSLEASGNVTLETVGEIARTGVERISSGALTHSARALDISLELEPVPG